MQEPRSQLDFSKGSSTADGNKGKFVRTAHAGWNKKLTNDGNSLQKIKINSAVVSDFRKGGKKRGTDLDDNVHDFDEHLAKHSTMANTM